MDGRQKGEGKATLSTSGTISLNGKEIKASGASEAGDFMVTVSGEAEVPFREEPIKIKDLSHTFDYAVNHEFNTTLHTFQ